MTCARRNVRCEYISASIENGRRIFVSEKTLTAASHPQKLRLGSVDPTEGCTRTGRCARIAGTQHRTLTLK